MRELVDTLFWVLMPIIAILLGGGFWLIDDDDRTSMIGFSMTLVGFMLLFAELIFGILLIVTVGEK